MGSSERKVLRRQWFKRLDVVCGCRRVFDKDTSKLTGSRGMRVRMCVYGCVCVCVCVRGVWAKMRRGVWYVVLGSVSRVVCAGAGRASILEDGAGRPFRGGLSADYCEAGSAIP
ncbi:hypothetical protein LZ31DRAFT_80039 [Colletotrichum somersetense]|nr:hypothetical protein LZ31DRAFT_80039 [Colletotrichum somersetense]